MGLKLRLNYFACLPHHMLGMSSVNQAAASLCAAECLLLWDGSRTGTTDTTDQLGGDAKDQAAEQAAYRSLDVHSHPVAVKLLSRSGELRAMVEAVAQGAAVKDVPPLDRVVKKWRFLSVIERSIEAKHSIAKKRLSHNSVPSAASFSLSIRMLEISSAMQAAGHGVPFLTQLSEDFAECKQPLLLVNRFGLASHPFLCQRLETHQNIRSKDIAAALYHEDIETTFLSHRKAAKEMKKRRVAHAKGLSKARASMATSSGAPTGEFRLVPHVPPDRHDEHVALHALAASFFQRCESQRSKNQNRSDSPHSSCPFFSCSTRSSTGTATTVFFMIVDPKPAAKQLTGFDARGDLTVAWSDMAVRTLPCLSHEIDSGAAVIAASLVAASESDSIGLLTHTAGSAIETWSLPLVFGMSSLLGCLHEWDVVDSTVFLRQPLPDTLGFDTDFASGILDRLVRASAMESSLDIEASRHHMLEYAADSEDRVSTRVQGHKGV